MSMRVNETGAYDFVLHCVDYQRKREGSVDLCKNNFMKITHIPHESPTSALLPTEVDNPFI